MYLIIVDAFSKWAEVKKMKNITASETIKAFNEYFCTWGLPFKLVTDNVPTLTPELFADFFKRNGNRFIKTTSYHPATNGAAENTVKTFNAKFELNRDENN